ncbi:MAG: glutathione S-transferase, partial [Sphingomonadales bacterium]|nr:glutathione S-transferase [Sphingomonadales bacterium]
MAELTLVIGNKNYSSWSMRAGVAANASGLAFEEVVLPLDTPEFRDRIGDYSPSGKVPLLIHGDMRVWDSLAIIEYLAELAPEAGLWPEDRAARARARAVSAEMHSGFAALRKTLPMNIHRP